MAIVIFNSNLVITKMKQETDMHLITVEIQLKKLISSTQSVLPVQRFNRGSDIQIG